jgi:heme/copper-type cytochrome/quinol oxidase subunit 2
MIAYIKKSFFALSAIALSAPVMVLAQGQYGTVNYDAGGGTGLPESPIWEIIYNLMQWLLYIIAFVAVIGFIISGILYLTSAGNEDRTQSAKNAMIASIIGVIVALLGLVILSAANNFLGSEQF